MKSSTSFDVSLSILCSLGLNPLLSQKVSTSWYARISSSLILFFKGNALDLVWIIYVEHTNVLQTLLDVLGNFPVWSLATYPSTFFTDINTKCVFLLSGSCVGTEIAYAMADAVSDFCVYLDGLTCLDLLVIDLVPCFFCFMCPISVASSTAK